MKIGRLRIQWMSKRMAELDAQGIQNPCAIGRGNVDVAVTALRHVSQFFRSRLPNVQIGGGRDHLVRPPAGMFPKSFLRSGGELAIASRLGGAALGELGRQTFSVGRDLYDRPYDVEISADGVAFLLHQNRFEHYKGRERRVRACRVIQLQPFCA